MTIIQRCDRRFRLSIVAVCAVCLLSAQQAPKPQQPSLTGGNSEAGTVTFTANTEIVVETVTVRDKNGKPIEGLTAKDFSITEDGVPQTIQFCDFQKFDDPAPGFAKRPEDKAKVEAPKPDADEPVKPKVESATRTALSTEAPGDVKFRNRRLLVLYFDLSAMPVPDQLRAFSSAQKFIKNQMSPSDLMAIMKYDNGAVKVLDDFTEDRDELNKTIDTLVAGEGLGFDEDSADASSSDTGSAFGQDDSEFNIFNTDRQLAAIQTAVRMLGSLNEKKSFVYFASGLRLNGINNQAQMQATVNAAIRANVVMFPIDARGLVATSPFGDATRGSAGGAGIYTGATQLAVSNSLQQSQDVLYTLAADTGGKALLDYNDLALGIVHAEEAISSYYIIGYHSTKSGTMDGKFRRIKITYNGDPSAKIEYRQGYFAGKVFSKFNTTDKERQLEDALMLGDPITDLTIDMEIDYFQLNRAEYYVPVAIKIPGNELALAKRGGAEHTVIDFIGEVKDEYNSTITNVRDKVDVKLTGETAQELQKHPILYDTGFTLLPCTCTVKVLARDEETGRIGTYMHKFVIPNLNKESKRIAISSVVLGSQRVDFKEALYNAAKDKGKSETVSPLVQDGKKLLPSVTRVFSRAKDMYVYLQAYQQDVDKEGHELPDAATFQPKPLVAFVTFYRGQAKAFETPPIQITESVANRLHSMPMKFSIPLDKLQAGRYNCQVTVLDPSGQKAAFWQAPIMLVP